MANMCNQPTDTNQLLSQIPGRTFTNWPPKLEEQEGSLAAALSAAAKAAGTKLGYRVLVTAVEVPPGGEAGGPAPPLLGPGEALVLPDLVAIGPMNAETAKRWVVGGWRQPRGGWSVDRGDLCAMVLGQRKCMGGRDASYW